MAAILITMCSCLDRKVGDDVSVPHVIAPVWTRTYNGPDGLDDRCYGVAVDSQGRVYAVGSFSTASQGLDAIVRKYDSGGNLLWSRAFNGSISGNDEAFSVTVDPADLIIVAGYTDHGDIWVRKYDPLGNVLWTRVYSGPTPGGDDKAHRCVTDLSGNVYVVGYETVSGQGRNIWLSKYDAGGSLVWTRTYNGPASADDMGYGVAYDPVGAVYVAGSHTTVVQGENIVLLKYDPDGNLVWMKEADGSSGGMDRGADVGVDSTGAVYVTGFVWVPGQSMNIWLRKFDSGGNVLWTRTFNGADNGWDQPQGISVTPSGEVYVCGEIGVAGPAADVYLSRWDATGALTWWTTHNGSAGGSDIAFDVFVAGSAIYVGGFETASGEGQNFWLRKYQ